MNIDLDEVKYFNVDFRYVMRRTGFNFTGIYHEKVVLIEPTNRGRS